MMDWSYAQKRFDASEDLKLLRRWTRMLVEATSMKYSRKVPDVIRHFPCLSSFSGGVLSRSQANEENPAGQDPKPCAERLMVMVVWLNG